MMTLHIQNRPGAALTRTKSKNFTYFLMTTLAVYFIAKYLKIFGWGDPLLFESLVWCKGRNDKKSALALRVLGSCTPNKCITIGRCSHLANPRVCPSRLAPSSLITSEYMIEGKQCHRIPTISRQVSVHNILSKSDKSSTYTDCWRHWVRNFRLSTDFAKIPFQSP